MFGFMKNKKEDFELVHINCEYFLLILKALFQLLERAGHNSQANFIQNLVEQITQENFSQFKKSINGVNMWGGSGAVWEVYFENKSDEKRFEMEIIKLINLMEETKILGKGIKPIRKIFENNLKS